MVHAPDHVNFSEEQAIAAIERLQRYDPSVSLEAVVDSIEDGSALLIPHEDGFSVVTLCDDALHIWISCAYNGHAPSIKNSLTNIIELAKLLELKRVTFISERAGWRRMAPKLGYKRDGTKYEITI